MEIRVLVNTVEKIQRFVSITNSSNYDIDLISGRDTYLDAKSIMGILSCDFKEPMTMIVNCNEASENEVLRSKLEAFIV